MFPEKKNNNNNNKKKQQANKQNLADPQPGPPSTILGDPGAGSGDDEKSKRAEK